MLQYDLSATTVARSDEALRPPSEGELLAITVALMLLSNCACSELRGRSLTLTQRNCRRVAELIEERTPPLAREFGGPLQLRQRLVDLVGLSVVYEGPRRAASADGAVPARQATSKRNP
jgi:hypothetical protein